MNIEIYTSNNCSYCMSAKALLQKNDLAFSEIDVSNDTVKVTNMVNRSGMRTVPQIYVDGELIGGYTELARVDRDGELVKI